MKRCHECLKWFCIKSYKMVFKEGIWVRSDYCNECYGKPHYRQPIKPTLQDYEQMGFVIGFIGKASYREICKYYGIRYEREQSKSSEGN